MSVLGWVLAWWLLCSLISAPFLWWLLASAPLMPDTYDTPADPIQDEHRALLIPRPDRSVPQHLARQARHRALVGRARNTY